MGTFYGNYKGSKFVAKQKKKKGRGLVILAVTLAVLAGLYCVAVFSNIPFVKKWREIYIQTAMSTMRHQWLATYFIPHSVIDDVMARQKAAEEEQIGVNSTDVEIETQAPWNAPNASYATGEAHRELTEEQKKFYGMFWELEVDSMETYLAAHPEAVAQGYDQIKINEAGVDDEGTSIYTTFGEQVLAIDVPNQILIVRLTDHEMYRGVLCVAKDPARLHLYPSAYMGSVGEHVADIAERHNGVLAMTGSSFIDDGGSGNGGDLAGWCMCDGERHGEHFGWSYKRIELRENNRFYITDAPEPVDDRTTDAVEFTPSLLVNGEKMPVGDWTSLNPRACIGQSEYGEILMLGIEGRNPGVSMGCSVEVCADIFKLHKGQTAINLDGGTSAIVWYDGEPIIRCSNKSTPEGRYLPNAWVYTAGEE